MSILEANSMKSKDRIFDTHYQHYQQIVKFFSVHSRLILTRLKELIIDCLTMLNV